MGIIGYKVFNPDWTCRGFQYEVGKTYKHDGVIIMCGSGFHFCKKICDCFNYYTFDRTNKVAVVEAIGDVITDGTKSVTNEIKIVKELSWYEVLDMCNTGNCNTGNSNTGNCNTGNCNTGNCNTGNSNTGNCNTGRWNTGNWNTGDWNTGSCNTGDWNTGNWNTGDWNTGRWNTGRWNTGSCNTGRWNTGNCNTGSWNTGRWNTGRWNTGNSNAGRWNTGNCNTGSWNTGSWNTTNNSTGFFNSIEQPFYIFNKPSIASRNEVYNNIGYYAMGRYYSCNTWVPDTAMTEKEKELNPEYSVTGGYLKTVDHKTACEIMWGMMTDEEKAAVKDLPNFDADIFEEITGIHVD